MIKTEICYATSSIDEVEEVLRHITSQFDKPTVTLVGTHAYNTNWDVLNPYIRVIKNVVDIIRVGDCNTIINDKGNGCRIDNDLINRITVNYIIVTNAKRE